MTRSLKWKIIWHAFYVILAMWYTLRVSISCIDRSLTIFISKVAMIRENLLDFILTEKVNYFALFFIFYLPELSIFVIYRNFGWTSNYKCFPFKEYGRILTCTLKNDGEYLYLSICDLFINCVSGFEGF